MLERYAIRKLLDITPDGVTATSEQHICDGVWNFDDFQIDCDENGHVVGLILCNSQRRDKQSSFRSEVSKELR